MMRLWPVRCAAGLAHHHLLCVSARSRPRNPFLFFVFFSLISFSPVLDLIFFLLFSGTALVIRETARHLFWLPSSDQISAEPRPIYSTSTDSDSVPINQTSANVLRAQYHQVLFFLTFWLFKIRVAGRDNLAAAGPWGDDIFPLYYKRWEKWKQHPVAMRWKCLTVHPSQLFYLFYFIF
jgi:hypothetical protein